MTNYELLRWLVEMPSRDVDHYRMINASRSTVCPRATFSTSGRHISMSTHYLALAVCCSGDAVQTGALLRASHEGDLDKVCALLQDGVPVDSANSVGHLGLSIYIQGRSKKVSCCTVIDISKARQ